MLDWLYRWIFHEPDIDHTIHKLLNPHRRDHLWERECPLCGQHRVFRHRDPTPGACWECRRCHRWHPIHYY